MREYVLHEASMRRPYGRLTPLSRVYRNWRDRRQVRKLLGLNDRLLKDIGFTRCGLERAFRRPLTVDINWENERLQLIRDTDCKT